MPNDQKHNHHRRCTSFCTANGYDLVGLAAFFKKKDYSTHISRDVLHVSSAEDRGDIYFFNHGCFVAWGYKKQFEDKIIEYVKNYSKDTLLAMEADNFCYEYGPQAEIQAVEHQRFDLITLASDSPQEKLAISYSLAQSIKLEAFEEEIQQAIKKHNLLPEEIATRGTISLSRRAIFKRMGEIFIVRRSINLNIEFLDVPEFFWRNPGLEPQYEMVKNFLDIPSRVQALNQKLDLLQELLDMLNSQVMHRHSNMLESIIILLICVEIIMSLFNFHMV